MKRSWKAMFSSASTQAISGSTPQNSVRWRLVRDFSARKQGPMLYTRPSAAMPASE